MKKIIVLLLLINMIFLTSCFKVDKKEETNTWSISSWNIIWTWEIDNKNEENWSWNVDNLTWEIKTENKKEVIKNNNEKNSKIKNNSWTIIEIEDENKETDKKVVEEIEDVLKSLDVPLN